MKKLILLLFVFQFQWLMAQKDSILYIGDPMCSWCYGFAEEISKVKSHFGAGVEFRLIMGGLRPYNKETMDDLGEFLNHHWESVSERSGQPFKYDILKDKSFVYDTEPPARAVWVVRQLNPSAEFLFFKDVQKIFYVENRNTALVASYLDLCDKYNIPRADFKDMFESQKAKDGVKRDFEFSNSLGIQGFPSVVYSRGGKHYKVAGGYIESKPLIKSIEKIRSQS